MQSDIFIHPIDDAMELLKMRDDQGMTIKAIAKETGKIKSWISRRLLLAEQEPAILELMREGKISSTPPVVTALNRIRDKDKRISFAMEQAKRNSSAKTIVKEVRKYFEVREPNKTCGATSALRLAKHIHNSKLPEWDALYQLGRVPAWPAVNDAVANTCDRCSLRPIASNKVCGSCALPEFLKGLIEIIDERK